MEPKRRQGHVSHPGLIAGVLMFAAFLAAFPLLMREGFVSFLFTRSDLRGQARIDQVRAIASATATSAAAEPVTDHTRPFATMIDNHPDALPQSGIAEA